MYYFICFIRPVRVVMRMERILRSLIPPVVPILSIGENVPRSSAF